LLIRAIKRTTGSDLSKSRQGRRFFEPTLPAGSSGCLQYDTKKQI
jgi:hypothetical protein